MAGEYCIDFEYKSTNEQNYDVVSVAIEEEDGTKRNWWLYKENQQKRNLKNTWKQNAENVLFLMLLLLSVVLLIPLGLVLWLFNGLIFMLVGEN